jgi:nitroimidazol reductase NimA-like FMN-containing flavoprotein (pyridoxamine 5'-phosphate oxidase superfamily)
MALPRELALDQPQIDEIMTSQWNLRVATIGPGSRINLTPMWFGWSGGTVYFYGRGQKIVNLRRNPTCTILVDRNERFPELQGIMLQGAARVLEDAEAEAADPYLAAAQAQMGAKYDGGHGQPPVANPGSFAATARGRNRRWIALTPVHTVTWDNFKLPRG